MNYPREWEEVNNDKEAGCARLKIYGGWLVIGWSNKGVSESLCFVPDREHDWRLAEKKEIKDENQSNT